jgi:hypothetical protein
VNDVLSPANNRAFLLLCLDLLFVVFYFYYFYIIVLKNGMIVMFKLEHLFTWSNKDKVLIGGVGYFGNSIKELENNIRLNKAEVLDDVYKSPLDTVSHVFKPRGDTKAYGLYIPRQHTNYSGSGTSLIRPIKTVDEFTKLVCELKEDLYIRNKDQIIDKQIYRVTVNAFEFHKGKLVAVTLGNKSYTLQELFDSFEFREVFKLNWKAFGVFIL